VSVASIFNVYWHHRHLITSMSKLRLSQGAKRSQITQRHCCDTSAPCATRMTNRTPADFVRERFSAPPPNLHIMRKLCSSCAQNAASCTEAPTSALEITC
jgi:hypothetical protein